MIKILDKFFEPLVFILAVFIISVFALGDYSYAVSDGISLWVVAVLPVLFPYFFFTAVLSSLKLTGKIAKKLSPITKKLFRTGGVSGYLFLISLISGYPSGAKGVSDAYSGGLLTKTEAERTSAFCSVSSPAFLISSVGAVMFGNRKLGVLLFFSNLISVCVVGFIFSFYKRNDAPSQCNLQLKKVDNVLYESVYSSVISILIVGGLITVFSLVSEIFIKTGLLSPAVKLFTKITGSDRLSKGIILGVIESTGGLKEISATQINFFTLPICATITGFGGLSVICQSVAFLKKAKIKTAPFFVSKVLSAVINFIVGIILSLVFL